MIIFHMIGVISGADLGSGFRFKMLRVGGSVAKASAAKVSMIRLTQSSWTAVNTESSLASATAEMKVKKTAVILTVIWNCVSLAMLHQRQCSRVAYLEELLDSVIHSSAPHDRFNDGRKVIIHQDDC